jgi:serine/threonine protein kinase
MTEPSAAPSDRGAAPPDFAEGRVVFGKYRLIEKIGEGSIGEVWRVWNADLEIERVLKLIRAEFAGDEEGWKRFEREARAIARLGHPNIVVIHDLKRTGSLGYIEMELVRGQSLDKILKESDDRLQALEWIEQVVMQLCSALQAAHEAGIIHRDIRPSHVMIVNHGNSSEPLQLKVLDFSIARLLEKESTASLSMCSGPSDTPAYASPELIGFSGAEGQVWEVDRRSDIYSAGVVVYQLLCGKPPFRGSVTDVVRAHGHAAPPSMADANPGVKTPPEVERLVMQCLEKDPDRRPRSARELGELFLAAISKPLSPPAAAETSLLEQIIGSMRHAERSQKDVPIEELVNKILRGKASERKFLEALQEIERRIKLADSPSEVAKLIALRSRLKNLLPPPPSVSFQVPPPPVPGDRLSPEMVPISRSRGMGVKLYVGNLSYEMTNSDLEQLFSNYGDVLRAEIITDRETGRSKGFGFVEMSSAEEARAAVDALHDREINGRRLTVNSARAREPRSGGGAGGYGGGRGGGYGGSRGGGYGGGDGRGQSQPKTIRRHTDVSFPARVQVGKVYNLRVQFVPAEEKLPSGEVRKKPKPHQHDATVDLTVPAPARPDQEPPPISLAISVAAENFEIEGQTRAEIVVPLVGKSPAVTFGMRGQEVGPGRIMVDFAQNGRPVSSVDLTPEVVDRWRALRPFVGQAPASGELSLDLGLGPAAAAPDVVLKVFDHRLAGHPGRLQFVLSSRHAALADLPVLDGDLGTLDLRTDVAGWVGDQLRAIGTLVEHAEPQTDDVARTLAAVGFNLFQHLLPPAVQELSWSLRQRGIKTLLILSDDPHIPWELIKPFRADPHTGAILSEDDFWGESYALAHWLRGRPPASRFSITRVLGVATTLGGTLQEPTQRIESSATSTGSAASRDMKQSQAASVLTESSDEPAAEGAGSTRKSLDAADEELALLRSLEALGARVERLPALRGAFRRAFEEGSFDLLHLVSHGSFGGTAHGDASAVFLDDGLFTAAELSPLMAGALRRTAPLVIFNTCHCGRMGFSLTRLGAWGAHLAQLGCGGFIGALWPVSDRAALAFARALYEQLAQNCALGEAVRLARLCVRERYPGDPTWLAYSCFADPTARIERAKAARY